MHTRTRRPFVGMHITQGGKAVLQDGDHSTVIGKDGINPFATATAAHFANFIDAIRMARLPNGSVQDNRATLALALAAYDSAESGKAVELEPYFKAPLDL